MWLFAIVIFLSAFLLFQVQPMIAKVILPWFGSSAGVWTACMMFFQAALLLGYTYSHGLVKRLSWRGQSVLHLAFLAASLAALPIMPSESWKPAEAGDPTWRIVAMLLLCVGGPYCMLASTGPLLQRWFGQLHPGRSPYRLFALSNAGSLAGLLTYPFLFEPYLTLRTQTTYWSIAYALFVLGCGSVAFLVWRGRSASPLPVEVAATAVNTPSAAASATPADAAQYAPVTAGRILLWLGLSACGAIMLVASTNLMTQDIAAVPFLWIVPLAVYLLTFIIAFDSPRWYYRPVLLPCVLLGAAALFWVSIVPEDVSRTFSLVFETPMIPLVCVFSLGLFAVCLGCHGELARAKPHPSRLTLYFLCISAGGALGGLFVGIIAPMFFLGYWEFPIALVCSVLLIGISASWEPGKPGLFRSAFAAGAWNWQVGWMVAVVATLVAGPFTDPVFREWLFPGSQQQGSLEVQRNFFGAWRTTERTRRGSEQTPHMQRVLVHGRIMHGFQLIDGGDQRKKTSYYGERSGVGLAILQHPHRNESGDLMQPEPKPLRIGVIGLGTGSLAAYAEAGDVLRFYEINPLLLQTAQTQFTYLSDARQAGADVDVYLGDARLVMERQAARGEYQEFDVLVVDAFSGDAIPIHLLTKECYDLYWKHLKPDGILAVHVSNKYLRLDQVVRGLAKSDDRYALRVSFRFADFQPEERHRLTDSIWMQVTRNKEFVKRMFPDSPLETIMAQQEHLPSVLWTDDFSSLLPVLYSTAQASPPRAPPANDSPAEDPQGNNAPVVAPPAQEEPPNKPPADTPK